MITYSRPKGPANLFFFSARQKLFCFSSGGGDFVSSVSRTLSVPRISESKIVPKGSETSNFVDKLRPVPIFITKL